MKKTICLLLLFGIVLTMCSCSMYGLDEQEASTTTAPNIVIVNDTTTATVENSTEASVVTPSQSAQTNPATTTRNDNNANDNTQTTLDAQQESIRNLETYYTDNPDNKYIVAVSDRFGVNRNCLVAFVRKNSGTPGATVLQFKGNRDSNGNLITTADELTYVYDVLDTGDIKKTNKDGSDTVGYTKISGRAAYYLVENYIMPKIDEFKKNNRLEG